MTENKALASVTFTRLAKLVAVLLVAAALWRAAPPMSPARVVVLVLPGFDEDRLPELGFENGPDCWGGSIRTPGIVSGALFWRRLFDQDAAGETDAPVWASTSPRIVVASAPEVLFPSASAKAAGEAVAPFVGGNSGMVVQARDIATKRIPAPYDRAIDRVAAAADSLRRGQWSDWLAVEIPDAGIVGEFQMSRFTDDHLFFSPVYVVAHRGAAERRSLARPFLRGLAPQLREVAAAHLVSLQSRRFAASLEQLRHGPSPASAVIFDLSAQEMAEVFLPGETSGGSFKLVTDAVAAEIADLREFVGPAGLVVLAGGSASGRDEARSGWLRILGVPGEATGKGTDTGLDFPRARVVLRYVLGVALPPEERAAVPVTLLSRLPIRSASPASATNDAAMSSSSVWSAEEIESVPRALAPLGG